MKILGVFGKMVAVIITMFILEWVSLFLNRLLDMPPDKGFRTFVFAMLACILVNIACLTTKEEK